MWAMQTMKWSTSRIPACCRASTANAYERIGSRGRQHISYCLKERYEITKSALDFAVGQVHQMLTYAVEDIKDSVETRLLSTDTDAHLPDIGDCFNVADPFGSLENEYMQTKYYRENFNLVVRATTYNFKAIVRRFPSQSFPCRNQRRLNWDRA